MKIEVDLKMLKRLLQLSHPDKHQGSEASHVATKWLLAIKDGRTPSPEDELPPFEARRPGPGHGPRKMKGVEVRCQLLRKSEKAKLVTHLETGEDIWFPISQIVDEDDNMDEVGATGSIWITEWIARQKGLV